MAPNNVDDGVTSALDISPLRVLIVEDDPADADLIREYVQELEDQRLEVSQAWSLAEAIRRLRSSEADLVLLDLRLPDGSGVESVRRIRSEARDTPIIVLTNMMDVDLGLSCVSHGAQDFLSKDELGGVALKRAISYSISRVQEMRVRELEDTLARYRDLSASLPTAPGESGVIKTRRPDQFQALARSYHALLERYRDADDERPDAGLKADMTGEATRLGDLTGGPRDLIDLHIEALTRLMGPRSSSKRGHAMVLAGRQFVLEMMGLLVDYYRVSSLPPFLEDLDDD